MSGHAVPFLHRISVVCVNFSIAVTTHGSTGRDPHHPYDSDVGTFKVVPEVPKPLLIFLIYYFFILFQMDIYFFLFQIIGLSPSFLAFSVGSLCIFRYFTLHSFHFFLYSVAILNRFCEQPDYQCFEVCI